MQPICDKESAEVVCKNLWSEIFGDSEEYISWYFKKKWKENEVFLLPEDTGVICSMLHCNPYEIKFQEKEMRLHYIVGVCTREDQRKKGFMGRLLRQAFAWLYEKEEPFTYLMPAREGIYEPYDFRTIYQAKKERVEIEWVEKEGLSEKGTGYYFVDYAQSTCQQKKDLEMISEDWLSSRYSLYVCRDRRYFQELADQMQACHGKCLLIYEGDALKGYLIYGAEGESVELFELFGAVEREEIYTAFYAYLKENGIDTSNGFQVNVTPFHDGVLEKGHSIMARIIHFPKCARLLSSSQPQVWRGKITDRYLSENNGKWQLNIDSKGCQVIPLPESEQVEKEMDIQEFCDYFFQNQKVYLNELV